MQKNEEKEAWYALRATYGRGLYAKKILDNDLVDNFIPQHFKMCVTKGGRKERKLVPFIKDLIFVHATSLKVQEEKLKIPYLLYITNSQKKPIIVPDRQMQQFKEVIETFNEQLVLLKPEEINLKQGVKVRIHGGPFDMREGIFIKMKGIRDKRVVIAIEGVAAVLPSIIHPDYVEVIDS